MKDDYEWTLVPTEFGTVAVTYGVLRTWNRYGWPTDKSLKIMARDHAARERKGQR